MSNISRKEVIRQLRLMKSGIKYALSLPIVSDEDKEDRAIDKIQLEAIEYAIASLETDEAYQLEYEPTTKNDLGVDECVNKQAVLNKILKFSVTDGRSVSVVGLWTEVNELPSVTPQEPRKGHWISHSEHCKQNNLLPSGLGSYFWCSECDCGVDSKVFHRVNYNYCPNCGCKMESEDKE